jgi:selenocysteine-specific elongation factor
MPIVGTAGHVDHGKSTLVEALTGRDPDRWAEEKRRGLTIDLGFAWADIDGIDVGFVDVPGHERFIKNMLAGIGAIDCALLVVAADSGWMPQTEEHAAVLDLLDVTSGVIALTRIDLVDSDTVELATLEIIEETEGTVLNGWPVVPVSPITGEGMDDLREHLAAVISSASVPLEGPLRMWVDRSFTVSGAGVIVTGTVARGSIASGDEIEILPEGGRDTVRGLHHHDEPTDHAHQGSRAAVNLQGAKLANVGRGNLLCSPGSIDASKRLVAVLRPARSFDEIPGRGAFHFHVGTAHTPATIRQLHGSDCYLINLSEAVPIAMGDRFILRDAGRQAVVGGGQVLEPAAVARLTENQLAMLVSVVDSSPDEKASALLSVRGISDLGLLAMASGGGSPSTGLRDGSAILSQSRAASVLADVTETVAEYHISHPLRPGMPKPELATQIGVSLGLVDATIEAATAIAESHGLVHKVGFVNELPPDVLADWAEAKVALEQSFDVPRMSAIELSDETVHALIRKGDLVRVGPDLVFTSHQIAQIQSRVADLPDGFSVSHFRDEFGMTRRQAVPMLEWLDKSGWTKRVGDGRTVRRRQ